MNNASRLSFLGPGLQRLRSATVSIVGAGGGGSHLAQQVAHLGVRHVALIEPDVIEETNVNRLVGSGYRDVGQPKATILAQRFSDLRTELVPVRARAESLAGRQWMERSDLVFGAVDGARARYNIERICRAALVPYIDIGLRIDVREDGVVRSIGGQIFMSLPGGPCLRCADIVNDEALVADREEYVIGRPEQQVISMNGLLASQAVNTMLALLTEYSQDFPAPVLVRYDGLLHRMQPDEYFDAPCPHYRLEDAGWHCALPPRRVPA